MKTTWNLELRSAKATREARAFRRELQSLQGMLEQVDSASARLNATLGRMASPAAVQRRVRGERAVAREVRSTYDAHRVGHRRVSQDLDTQGRIRRNVDRALRSNATREDREQGRRRARNDRNAQHVARLNASAFRRDQADARARERTAQSERDFRVRTANEMLGAYGRQQAAAARARRADFRQDRANRRAGWTSARGAASMVGHGAIGIAGATVGAAATFALMASTAAQLTLSIGESVLQMIAFREAALTTLRVMNGGNASVASEQFSFARQFARETPLDTEQVLDLQRQTTAAGFRGAQNRRVLMTAADVGAFNQSDPDASRRFMLGLTQMRNASAVRLQDLRQVTQSAGLQENDVLEETARRTGRGPRAGESAAAFRARVQRMQTAGQFTGEQGTETVLAMLERRSGGQAGGLARAQGESLMGTLSNVRGAVFDLVTGIDRIEQLPGIRLLKSTLNSIASTIAGATPTGKRLQGIVSTIVNDVGMLVGGGLGDFDATLNSTLDTAKDFLPIVRDVLNAFGGGALTAAREQFGGIGNTFRETFGNRAAVMFASQLGRSMVTLFGYGARVTGQLAAIAGIVTVIAGHLVPLLQGGQLLQSIQSSVNSFLNPVTLGDHLRARMMGPGAQAVLGLREGIQSAMPGLRADVAAMANTIPTTTTQTLDIKSPSRVMADEVGRFIPLGIAAGIESGRGPLDAAMGDLVPVPSVGGPLGARGGLGGAVFQFNVTVPPGTPAEVGEGIAEAAFDKLLSMLEVPALAG